MPPPPVTPSPHRFVIKKERPAVRSTPLAQEHTPHPSTQPQFNSTPRFTFSSTPRPTASQTLPPPRFTPSTARFVTPASRTPRSHDAIELSSDDGLQDVHDSTETEEQDGDLLDGYQSEDLEDDYKLEEPSPKRRRLSTSSQTGLEEQQDGEGHEEMLLDDNEDHNDAEASSSLPILSSPPAPRRPLSTTAPRFLLSTPLPQSTPSSTVPSNNPNPTPFLKPPRFCPPDPSSITQTQTDPLPEQFSPHRKGQKYVAGGLAAEVRDWLMNIKGAIPGTEMRGKKKGEEWVVRILVEEVSGSSKGGMTMVKGRQVVSIENKKFKDEERGEMLDTLGMVKVILAGEGAGTGLQKGSPVEKGRMVGIKGPVWEVVIEGEKWGVGVDWKVLS